MAPVYWIVALLTGFVGNIAEKNPSIKKLDNNKEQISPNKVAVFFLGLVLILVAGLRYYVGTDFGAYYINSSSYLLTDLWDRIVALNEPGIVLLSLIGNAFIRNDQTLIFVCSLFTIILFVFTIFKRSPTFTVSMLLFLFLGVWHGSFNGIRQYLAAAIIFAGFNYIIERKFFRYLLIILLAFLFHKTALVMIVPYFILNRKPDFKQIILLLVSTLIILGSYDFIFETIGSLKGKEIDVTGDYYSRSVNVFRILVAASPSIMYFAFCRKDNHSKEEIFFVNAILLNTFTAIASMSSAYLARVDIYTNIFVIIGFGYLVHLIEDEKTQKIILIVSLVLYFIYWWYSIYTVNNLRNYHWVIF